MSNAAAVVVANQREMLVVTTRDGSIEEVRFDKILDRIRRLCVGLDTEFVEPSMVAKRVIAGLYPRVTTRELDTLAAETAAAMTIVHPDYSLLAARIATSNLFRETKERFSDVIHDLAGGTGSPPIIAKRYALIVAKNAERLNLAIDYHTDCVYNYAGFKTLERSYLLKLNGRIVERPQHLCMRVAIGIHGENIDAAIETYRMLAKRMFTHASPTLFAAATRKAQMSSCFLLASPTDSITGIFDTLSKCATISKYAGGIGLSVHNIRAKGSSIDGSNNVSNGLVPMLRVYNNTARYVDQGGNKRPGAFAVYVEPWHADIREFLNLRKNTGAEEMRARDLFYGLWIPDLFMQRVEDDGVWSLMSPDKCKALDNCYGDEFEALYCAYEHREGYVVEQMSARKLWAAIIDSQIETGTPYMLYKDACNRKSNQKNLGTITCSNLCTEIIQFTSEHEIAVCNLASVALGSFVDTKLRTYDFEHLRRVVHVITRNLNKIIDVNYYPLEEARYSNMRHRPIGIGVQGLADAFILMRLPYDSEGAQRLNIQIFETLYYAALEASCELAIEHGPYSTYTLHDGCPVSKGILQYDMWGVTPTDLWDWDDLKRRIARHGVRNSLLIAPMPTASTAQILGNNEAFEPYTSNIYNRRVLSGEFQTINQHLVRDLIAAGLWSDEMRNAIIHSGGSVKDILSIPEDLRLLYRTVWEVPLKMQMKMSADRGAFIDQSQSLNLHVARPTYRLMTSIHFYGWHLGLKTGMYYLRTKPAADAIQFTVDTESALRVKRANATPARSCDNDDDCMACGS